MKKRAIIFSIIHFLFLSSMAFANSGKKNTALDVFGLSISTDSSKVSAADPNITVTVNFANKTTGDLRDVLITTHFPNISDQYCTFESILHNPDGTEFRSDALSRKWASWGIKTLSPGQKDSIVYRLKVDRFPADTLFFHHIVEVLSEGHSVSQIGTDQTWIPSSQGGWGTGPNIWLRYETIDKDGFVSDSINVVPGDRFRLRLRFGNSHEYNATNIRVRDFIPAELTPDFANGTLMPQDSTFYSDNTADYDWFYNNMILSSGEYTIEFPVTVTGAPAIPIDIESIGGINSHITDVQFNNNSDKVFIHIDPQYDLILALLEPQDATLAPDASETYNLIIYNESTAPVNNFSLAVSIDDGLAGAKLYDLPASTDPNLKTNKGDSLLIFTFATLNAGDSINTELTVNYLVKPTTSGHKIAFEAVVDSQFIVQGITMPDINPPDNWLNWRRDFEDEFDLVIEPTPANNKQAIALNSPQTYNITVSNNSLLTMPPTTLSLAIVPIGIATLDNIHLANIPSDVTTTTVNGVTMMTWPVAELGPDASANFSFDASIISVATGGYFGFEIHVEIDSIAGERDFGNNRRIWQTTGDVSSDLAVLSVTPDNPAPNPGESVNFAIKYANLGTLPKDSAWLHAIITGNPDVPVFHLTDSDNAIQNGDTLSWLITPLPARGNAGDQGTKNLTITFDNVTEEGRYQIEVYAEIDTHGDFDDPGNNSNRATVELAALPHLSMGAIEFSGLLQESENLSYIFTISNSGNFPAREMQLDITIPQATEFRSMLAAGQAATPAANGNVYTFNIAELAPDASISFTVGVQVIERVELLRQFQHGSNISLDFTAVLTDGAVVIERKHNTGLGIPRIEESFYLTRNIFRPAIHENVSFTYDMIADTEVIFKIYNMAGELVREFAPASGIIGRRVRLVWNGRNNENELVGSGLYFIFAEVKGSSNRPMQKLIVVR